MELEDEDLPVSSVLEGKSFVISGTFRTCPADSLRDLIGNNGGKNTLPSAPVPIISLLERIWARPNGKKLRN